MTPVRPAKAQLQPANAAIPTGPNVPGRIYVPIEKNYEQMLLRLNSEGPIKIPDTLNPKNHIHYYNRNADKVGEYLYQGDITGSGNVSLNDGKTTCVVLGHMDKRLSQLPYSEAHLTPPPIKFDYCYEDPRK